MSKVVPLEGFGGGSSPLNFKIVAYATEEELIAAQPRKNTIGIVTTTPITGYRFSATEPEGMIDGKVWISTGTNSNSAFDIVNDVTIYPISAKQYVDGIWVDVIAKSYQNGAWVEWITYLYNFGNEFKDFTGGIIISNTSGGSITKNSDHITIRGVGITDTDTHLSAYTKNKIDLTNFKTLAINEDALLSKSDVGSNPWICVLSAPPTSFSVIHGNSVIALRSLKEDNVLDLTGISGKYYVGVTCTFSGTTNYYANIDVKSLILR